MLGEEDKYIYRGQCEKHKFITPSALRDGAFEDSRTLVDIKCLDRYDFTLGKSFFPFNSVHDEAYRCTFLSLANFFLHIQRAIKNGSPQKNLSVWCCRSKYAMCLLDIDDEKILLDKCYEYSKHMFNGPVFNIDEDNCTQFNNLFLTMSDYQHANANELKKNFPEAYFPSMMLDFTESIAIAECFAKKYEPDGVVYKANFSRISEILSFRPDLYNALSSAKDTKTSELNLSFLGMVLYCETNNELARKEQAINIFWPWKILKSEINKICPKNTILGMLNLEKVKTQKRE